MTTEHPPRPPHPAPASDTPAPPGTPGHWSALADTVAGHALVDDVKRTLGRTPTPPDIKRWRALADDDAELVACAISLARAQRAHPDRLRTIDGRDPIFDHIGAQEATPWQVGAHKARTIAQRIPHARVLDLCSGIGADTCELARADLDVEALDALSVRTWMTTRHAACPAHTGTAEDHQPDGRVLHADPERRTGTGRRLFRPEDLAPPLTELLRIASDAPGAMIKLGPGIDLADLTPHLPSEQPHSLEHISLNGVMTQGLLRLGALADGASARATAIDGAGHVRFTMSAEPDDAPEPPVASPEPGAHLLVTDPSIERARLLAVLARELELTELAPGLGVLAAQERTDHPALTAFELLEHLPWRPARVRDALRSHDAGIVEVKTRAKACDPDRVQTDMRGQGAATITLFVLRLGRGTRAFITRRVAP